MKISRKNLVLVAWVGFMPIVDLQAMESKKKSHKTYTELQKEAQLNNELLRVVQKKGTTSDEVIALIDKGANVNAIDQYGYTPLIWAARNNLADPSITLITKGADLNAKSRSGWTPLIWATINGHRDVCMLLLRHLLLKQLLAADPEKGDLSTRKMRMRCAILTLRRTNISKYLITFILQSKPLMRDYTACRYDTYCCRPRLNAYNHLITRDQLFYLLGQGNIDVLKTTLQQACHACSHHPDLKNLLNPVNFDQHFDELFLKPLKPTIGE